MRRMDAQQLKSETLEVNLSGYDRLTISFVNDRKEHLFSINIDRFNRFAGVNLNISDREGNLQNAHSLFGLDI